MKLASSSPYLLLCMKQLARKVGADLAGRENLGLRTPANYRRTPALVMLGFPIGLGPALEGFRSENRCEDHRASFESSC